MLFNSHKNQIQFKSDEESKKFYDLKKNMMYFTEKCN